MAEFETVFAPSKKRRCKIDKFCRICGAKAISYNYNGLAWESCKSFFRRYSFRPNNFQCHDGTNKCDLTQINRKKCKRCRMDQCFAIGMKKELIWKSKYTQKLIEFSDKLIIEKFKTLQNNRNLNINQYEQKHLDELELAIANIPEEKSFEIAEIIKKEKDFGRYPSMYIKIFVKYCKSLSSFILLNEDDQFVLVKSSYVQTLNIRFAFSYNPETGKFAVMGNEEGTKAILMDFALLYDKKNIDPNQPIRFIRFQQSLNLLMENDVTIRNLIIIQFLFANHNENLHRFEFIRHQYYFYCKLLLRYYEHKHQCITMAKQKYFTLMQALFAMDYQVEKIREMFKSNAKSGNRDVVHMEIFDFDSTMRKCLS